MLRVMIIGSGGISPAHIEGYLKFPKVVKVVSICDTNLDRARQLSEKYNLNCQLFTDFNLGLNGCDIVSICTPPSTHRNMAVASLMAKKHVLLEKPMALSLEECDEIISAASSNGVIVSVVAQSRFINGIRNAINLVKTKKFGKNLYADVHSYWYRGQSYYDLAWRGTWESEGGGCTLNHAVHHIDLLLWAKGMPNEVTSIFSNLNHNNSEEEDISVSILKYEDKSLASLTASIIHHGEKQSFNFQCERAGISIPFDCNVNIARENGFPLTDTEGEKMAKQAFDCQDNLINQHHDGQIENFLNAILGKEELQVNGYDGRNTLELITAIYKSATINKAVSLPLEKNDEFYTREGLLALVPRFNKKSKNVECFTDTTITSFKDKF